MLEASPGQLLLGSMALTGSICQHLIRVSLGGVRLRTGGVSFYHVMHLKASSAPALLATMPVAVLRPTP